MIPDFENFDANRRLFFESFLGLKTIQLFPDNKTKKTPFNLTKIVNLPGEKYPDAQNNGMDKIKNIPFNYIMRLEEFNAAGAGVYLVVNETNGNGRKATDVIRVRSVFADFDGVPLPINWDIEPSMIIESSLGKYHAYWLTDDTPIGAFSQLQKAIAYKFNSDPIVHDLSRVMRVPGFYHNKKEPFLTRIIMHTGLKYSFGILQEVFPPKPVEKWSAPKYDIKNIDPNKKFKGQYGAFKGNRNHHIAKRIGGMLKRGLSWDMIEIEAYKEAQACSPALSQKETFSILRSLKRYA